MTKQACKNAVERALSTLANTMRLYVEACMRSGRFFAIDREEAINNLDRAFEAKLEAFHSLYDVSKALFPYFGHGDTALLIAVRNAIHHADHPLFRSLYAGLFIDDEPSRWIGASFLMASYSTLHGGSVLMNHYIRLSDVDLRLDPSSASPHADRFLKPHMAAQRFELIQRELSLNSIRQKAALEHYPENHVYLDLMPIFISGVGRVFKAMKAADIAFKGFDANVYLGPFTSEIEVDLCNPKFTTQRIGP